MSVCERKVLSTEKFVQWNKKCQEIDDIYEVKNMQAVARKWKF